MLSDSDPIFFRLVIRHLVAIHTGNMVAQQHIRFNRNNVRSNPSHIPYNPRQRLCLNAQKYTDRKRQHVSQFSGGK